MAILGTKPRAIGHGGLVGNALNAINYNRLQRRQSGGERLSDSELSWIGDYEKYKATNPNFKEVAMSIEKRPSAEAGSAPTDASAVREEVMVERQTARRARRKTPASSTLLSNDMSRGGLG